MTALDGRGGVFRRLAARSLKLNRTRTVVSIIGIALSCALITAIFTSVATLYSGLLKAEIMTEGAWQVEFANLDAAGLERLREDPRVSQLYERVHHGDALMPESFEGYWGRYLSVQEWPTSAAVAGLRPLPHIACGRGPRAPGKIVLNLDLKGQSVETGGWLYEGLPSTGLDDTAPCASWDGTLELGSTIELALGQRVFVDPETGSQVPCLYNEPLYTATSARGDVITEYLKDPGAPASYTVVGFHAPEDDGTYDQWGSSGPGYLGFVCAPGMPALQTSAYVATDLTTRSGIDEFTADYASATSGHHGIEREQPAAAEGDDQAAVYTHDSLLRYQGMVDDRSIWGTLYMIAAILSAVVVVASVSLIYNAFAIAVSERTRQFGLLSSLGASRRQLRRTVYAEALMLSALGIPAGLAIGLAGTFVVFNVAGEGVGMLIDQQAFEGSGLTAISVEPAALVVSALLALVTVLISAAIPAWRASRVSAVDAIRANRDVRPARRERAEGRAGRRNMLPRCRLLDAHRLRVGGVPALLAHRNLTRAAPKGRVAVASLAVSVALIIISGSISHYLGYLTQAVDSGGSDIEVALNRLLQPDETAADGLADIDTAYRKLARVAGARGEGYMLIASLYGCFETGMVDYDELSGQSGQYAMPDRGMTSDGIVYAPPSVLFVDETSWREILDANDLPRARYDSPDSPVAVALNGTQARNGERYTVHDLFESTGTARLFTHIASMENGMFTEIDVDEQGVPIAHYEGYGSEGIERYDEDGNPIYQTFDRPLSDVLLDSYDLPVDAIVTTFPAPIAAYASIWPTLVLPAWALPALAAGTEDVVTDIEDGSLAAPFAFHSEESAYGNTLYAYLSFAAENARDAATEMSSIIAGDLSGSAWYRTHLSNNAENVRTTRLMAETVQLFIACFIAITAAIAVANVFNTLTSSIILRRREFATLKSMGMEDRAFWKMIALECASFAWRGLAIGLALGAGVTFLIYQAMRLSFEGLAFSIPLGWTTAAVCLVAGVLALSTRYALRRSRMGSIVTVLREDAA